MDKRPASYVRIQISQKPREKLRRIKLLDYKYGWERDPHFMRLVPPELWGLTSTTYRVSVTFSDIAFLNYLIAGRGEKFKVRLLYKKDVMFQGNMYFQDYVIGRSFEVMTANFIEIR